MLLRPMALQTNADMAGASLSGRTTCSHNTSHVKARVGLCTRILIYIIQHTIVDTEFSEGGARPADLRNVTYKVVGIHVCLLSAHHPELGSDTTYRCHITRCVNNQKGHKSVTCTSNSR